MGGRGGAAGGGRRGGGRAQHPRLVDGYGRILLASDVRSLASATNTANAAWAEDKLFKAWSATTGCALLSRMEAFSLFGRMCIRVMAHIFKKQKDLYRTDKEHMSLV